MYLELIVNSLEFTGFFICYKDSNKGNKIKNMMDINPSKDTSALISNLLH